MEQKTLRRDAVMAQIVEAGIAAQQLHGRAAAIAYLVRQQVRIPTAVIGRVLAEPRKRRGTR